MSDLMFYGVLEMPYALAMSDEISRLQFYQRAQQAVARLKAAEAAPADPLDTPLPYDITVGAGTLRAGVPLRTLVARMQVLHDMAMASPLAQCAAQAPLAERIASCATGSSAGAEAGGPP